MIKIVSFKICPYVQRVTAALEARNIKYDIEYISLKDKPEWFLELSPNGQVPIMITENKEVLFESDAIIEYINDEYGFLNNEITNIEKAHERAWSYLATKNYMTQCGAMRSKNCDDFKEKKIKLSKEFTKIEKVLRTNDLYFSGNSLNNVDIAWMPILHRFNIIRKETGFDYFKDFPKIKQWQNEILKLEIVKNSVSEDFYELFINFYVNNNCLEVIKTKYKKDCC